MSSNWEFVNVSNENEVVADNEVNDKSLENEKVDNMNKIEKKISPPKYRTTHPIYRHISRTHFLGICFIFHLTVSYFIVEYLLNTVLTDLVHRYRERYDEKPPLPELQTQKFPNPLLYREKSSLHFTEAMLGDWYPVENHQITAFLDKNPSINREFFAFSRISCQRFTHVSINCHEWLQGHRSRLFDLMVVGFHEEPGYTRHSYWEDDKNTIKVVHTDGTVEKTVYSVRDGKLYVKSTRNGMTAWRIYQRALDL